MWALLYVRNHCLMKFSEKSSQNSPAKDRILKVDRPDHNNSQFSDLETSSPTIDKTKLIKQTTSNFKYTSTVAYLKPSDATDTKCTIEQRIKGKAPKRKVSRARITPGSHSSINNVKVNSALVQKPTECKNKFEDIVE